MKLIVERDQLWPGIDTVIDAVATKPALPILSNILLSAQKGELILAGTDLDLSIRTAVPATVREPGSITVPARTLAGIAREWPASQLSIEVADNRLLLSGKLGAVEGSQGVYSLAGISPDEFPEMPSTIEGLNVDLNGFEDSDSNFVGSMLNKTSFAISRDETRPVLNGVFWVIDAEGMTMVATDGYRFARNRHLLDLKNQVGDKPGEVILPPQTSAYLVKMLNGQRRIHRLTLGASQVLFDLGSTQVLSRVIEGPYVNYEPVIPRQNDKVMRISKEMLLPAVRRVSILSSTHTHQVRMRIQKNQLELSAASPEIGGEAREVIPANYSQEELDVGYNANYLIEILRKIEADDIVFELHNAVTAALVRPGVQDQAEDYFCLLMPLRPSA
ncbi:MAG: DNA polymerase III subunit beta [Candidatus Handelsmanbacteria bacterium]|nr:DNA polymerase III subunit beta [Candidatus Handelsmanbacteria bacterium]